MKYLNGQSKNNYSRYIIIQWVLIKSPSLHLTSISLIPTNLRELTIFDRQVLSQVHWCYLSHDKISLKSCTFKINFLNGTFFDISAWKWIEHLFKFHHEIIVPFVQHMVSWIQNMKDFNIIKVSNKYVWNQLVNMVFKITFSIFF